MTTLKYSTAIIFALLMAGSAFGQSVSCSKLFEGAPGGSDTTICRVTDASGHERFTEIHDSSTEVITKARFDQLWKDEAQWRKTVELAGVAETVETKKMVEADDAQMCATNPNWIRDCKSVMEKHHVAPVLPPVIADPDSLTVARKSWADAMNAAAKQGGHAEIVGDVIIIHAPNASQEHFNAFLAVPALKPTMASLQIKTVVYTDDKYFVLAQNF
jgi:hypothetical protein